MGINVKHLFDRPCSVCEFHKENGCCKWSCVFEQEPFKPMVEIDLYSVIKQKYIERDVLDKIRAEIEKLRPNLRPEQMTDYDYAMVEVVDDIVAILDKYKAESEVEDE